MNKRDFELNFWYVIYSAGLFADTIEKRISFREFLYEICSLISGCYNRPFNVLYEFPLEDVYLENKEILKNWIDMFRKYCQCENCPKDISSEPKKFGRYWWFIIHFCAICSGETLEERRLYVNMIKNMVKLIPCKRCCEHAKSYVYDKNPVELHYDNFYELFKWAYDFHEYANDNTGVSKKTRPTFEQVCYLYGINPNNEY